MSAHSGFTTITDKIRGKASGLQNYLKYLLNQEEHKDEEIWNYKFFNKDNFFNHVKTIYEQHTAFKKEKKLNNRVDMFAQSFCLSLPHIDRDLNREEINEVIKEMLKWIKKEFDLTKEDIFVNVHYRRNKNTHFNFVLNKLKPDRVLDLGLKSNIFKFKRQFTKVASEILKIDPPTTIIEKLIIQVAEQNKTITSQNEIIEKQITQAELAKWTFIYLDNFRKYSKQNDKLKANNNLDKANKNIEKMKITEEEKEFYKNKIIEYVEEVEYDKHGNIEKITKKIKS